MSSALVILSYGAPEQQDEVVPFLQHLFDGQNVPPQRFAAAVEKYEKYAAAAGHYSPLKHECKTIATALQMLSSDEVRCAYLFSPPLLDDTIEELLQAGVDEINVFITSAFCVTERYKTQICAAEQRFHCTLPILNDRFPVHAQRLFIEAQTDSFLTALAHCRLENNLFGETQFPLVFFSAHSILADDANAVLYVKQLQETCKEITALLHEPVNWELVFQSAGTRAGDWLQPDIKERIRLSARGRNVLVVPVGFFCDNMETQYDLDVEVRHLCDNGYYRASCAGTSPKIVQMLAQIR